jgi:hypothetical protein
MRRPVDEPRLRQFMEAFGLAAMGPTQVFFTGGATAVLLGWREATVDIDLAMEPEDDQLYRVIPGLKESLELNVELAAPSDFIPELPGWRERSLFITTEGQVAFHHYDFYAQVLAKIERGHALDLVDIAEMKRRGLVEPGRVGELFEGMAPQLYRYPDIDPPTFRRAVAAFVEGRPA